MRTASTVRTIAPDGTRVLAVGYNTRYGPDYMGTTDPVTQYVGASYSRDDGATWTVHPPFPVPTGLARLQGDPWLATNEAQTKVVFTFVARTDAGARVVGWVTTPPPSLPASEGASRVFKRPSSLAEGSAPAWLDVLDV